MWLSHIACRQVLRGAACFLALLLGTRASGLNKVAAQGGLVWVPPIVGSLEDVRSLRALDPLAMAVAWPAWLLARVSGRADHAWIYLMYGTKGSDVRYADRTVCTVRARVRVRLVDVCMFCYSARGPARRAHGVHWGGRVNGTTGEAARASHWPGGAGAHLACALVVGRPA